MFKFCFAVCLFAMLIACKQNNTAANTTSIAKDSLLLFKLPVNPEKIIGFYKGDFDGAPISIIIRYISGKNISGYNIHRGIKRNLTGTIAFENNQLHLQLNEPVTEKYDGKFDIFLDTTKLSGKATWWPVVNKSIAKKEFTLTKQFDEDFSVNGRFEDSLNHTINLNPNGICEFVYYLDTAKVTEQMFTINGNYTISKDSLTIFWQANTLFTDKKTLFKMSKIVDTASDNTFRVLTSKFGIYKEVYMP